ncbi:MAG: UPF0280 family protein [Acetobacteraceae bacterium]
MRVPPQARPLAGGRLHLQHGPIDLIVHAFGAASACRDAYAAATQRFATVLDELCAELAALRAPAGAAVQGVVARRMQVAVEPHAAAGFITAMAAVAGSVADEILAAMTGAARLERAFVNNGGDIALHLTEGTVFRVGLIDRPDRPGLFGTTVIRAADGIGGIATSGWGGRSFSLGIADAATVLAATAAMADAAATVVANAVDLPGHEAISRVPARDIQADSDLGARLVTRDVGPLQAAEIAHALERGAACAEALAARGLIRAAALHCQGWTRIAGQQGCLAAPEHREVRVADV